MRALVLAVVGLIGLAGCGSHAQPSAAASACTSE
jgi:hypothetical protein